MKEHTHETAGPYGYCAACNSMWEMPGWAGLVIGFVLGFALAVVLFNLAGG